MAALVDDIKGLSRGNEGNAEGLAARQKALRDLGAGAASNTPKPAPPAKAVPAPRKAPDVGPDSSGKGYGSKPGEKRFKLGPDGEILGSYKKGGKVKKTGVYRLHKGERVLNRKQTKKMQKKGMKAVLSGKA